MKQYKANGHAMPVKSDGVTKLQSDGSPVHTDQIIRQKGTVTIPLMYGKGTKGVPLMYGECTGGVLKRYCKGTTNVLRRYWTYTKDLLSVGTPRVPRDRTDRQSVGHDRTRVRGGYHTASGSVGALFGCCSTVLRQLFGYESKRCRSGLEEQSKPTRRGLEQESNKSRSDVEEIGLSQGFLYRTSARLDADILSFFIFDLFVGFQRMVRNKAMRICVYGFVSVLFNNAALAQSHENGGADAGHRIVPVDNKDDIVRVKANPQNDLEMYPMKRYEIDPSLITPVQVGDSIPEELMNMPLWVVSKDIPSDTIRLADIPSDHLIVLDFWAGWCAPCVASMDRWEGYMQELSEEIVFFGVHMDYDFKAYPFIQKRDWMSKSIIGLGGYVLNYSFFDQVMVSYLAWIKDRRLIALTPLKEYDLQMVKDIIQGKEASLAIRAAKQRSYKKEKR